MNDPQSGFDKNDASLESRQLEINAYELLEETLWKTARRFQALIENSSDMVVILDANGLFRYSSPSMKVLGYASEDIVGRTIFEFTHPEDLNKVTGAIETALQCPGTGIAEVEYRFRDCNGSWHTFAATFTNLLQDPVVDGILVNCHDVTKRKEAELALRQSEERFRQVISSISDHIYVTEVTETGNQLNRYISPNVEALTGYLQEKFMTDRGFWQSLIHPDDRAAATIQAAQLDGGRDSEIEYRLIRADGKVIWVRDSGRVRVEGSSKIIYGVISNITERKQLEEQFRQSQKMEAVGRLAGGVAHDFNNLLTIINGNCELILSSLNSNDPLCQEIEQINKAGERAASLTRHLLAFSRKQVLQSEILSLNTIVGNMDKMLRRLIGEDIDLITVLEPQLGLVKADPGQMEQVIMNLVVNARDAMPQGGKLTIETANLDLDENYSYQRFGVKPGPYVMVALSDNGHGMDEEVKARIFEPFFTTKEQGQGTGLGLATVHGIINQSGGHIWVYSEPGQGSSFKIYLPRVRDEAATPSQKPMTTVSLRGSETILLVEDDDMVREFAQRVLRLDGYTVLEARQGGEALRLCERYTGSIQLLITDIVMPGGMSGGQLAERLTSLRPEMQVLYMSGYTDKAIIHQGMLDLKAAFLNKPFTPSALARKVRQLLDKN
jgi:PAS domain S-box-containing protein